MRELIETEAAEVIGADRCERCEPSSQTRNERRASDRRYLSEGSMALLYSERDTDLIAELNSGD